MSKVINLFVVLIAVAVTSCASTKGPKRSFFTQDENGVTRGPCVNLHFVDRNYPEELGKVIRLYKPKVDPQGAYKITVMQLKREKKRKSYAIDTKSAKLCREKQEIGYSFRVVKVQK